jgi:hypothetical protein
VSIFFVICAVAHRQIVPLAKPEEADAFAKRFGGERREAASDPENKRAR